MLREKLRTIVRRWKENAHRIGAPNCVSAKRLAEIDREFNEKMAQGWFAAGISDDESVAIRRVHRNAGIDPSRSVN